MAGTDKLLKQLISICPQDFAEWLLQTKVQAISPCTTELLPPTDVLRADQVFQVTTATGRKVILHLEFQGRNSHKPMPQRELAYIARLAEEHQLPLRSVVFYVGQGAGKGDSGQHSYPHEDGGATLIWRYDVFRLWEMTAEELLKADKLGLAILIGQTKITNPATTVPTVISQIGKVADAELRGKLLTLLVSLISDEELLAMIEQLVVEEEEFTETPYMRQMRELRQLRKKYKESRKKATLTTLQRSILQILRVRLAPSDSALVLLKTTLAKIADAETLQAILLTASLAENLPDFQAALAQHTEQKQN